MALILLSKIYQTGKPSRELSGRGAAITLFSPNLNLQHNQFCAVKKMGFVSSLSIGEDQSHLLLQFLSVAYSADWRDASATFHGFGSPAHGRWVHAQDRKRSRHPEEGCCGFGSHLDKRQRSLEDGIRFDAGGGQKRKREVEEHTLSIFKFPRVIKRSFIPLVGRPVLDPASLITLLLFFWTDWIHGKEFSPGRQLSPIAAVVPWRFQDDSKNDRPRSLRGAGRCTYFVWSVGAVLAGSRQSLRFFLQGTRGSRINSCKSSVALHAVHTCSLLSKWVAREVPHAIKTGIGWVSSYLLHHLWHLGSISFTAVQTIINIHSSKTSRRYEMGSSGRPNKNLDLIKIIADWACKGGVEVKLYQISSSTGHTTEGESSSCAYDHKQAGTAEKQPRFQI